MLGCLGLVYQYQMIRFELADLFHDLLSDTAGGACDHDTLTFQLFADGLHVYVDLFSRQQVFDADLLQFRRSTADHFLPFLGLLREIDVDAGLDEFVYQCLILQESLFAVGRDDQRLDTFIRHGLYQLYVEFVHSHTHQNLVLHPTVV